MERATPAGDPPVRSTARLTNRLSPARAPVPPPPPTDVVRRTWEVGVERLAGIWGGLGAAGWLTAIGGRRARGKVLDSSARAVALVVGGGDAVRAGADLRRRLDRRSAFVVGGARECLFGRTVGPVAPGMLRRRCMKKYRKRQEASTNGRGWTLTSEGREGKHA